MKIYQMQAQVYYCLSRILLIFGCVFVSVVHGQQADVVVHLGTFPDSIVSNQFYIWPLRVSDTKGRKISGLAFQIQGRMPEHAHGLPSEPKVVEEASGEYRIKGLFFNMPGRWVVEILLDGKVVLRQELMVQV